MTADDDAGLSGPLSRRTIIRRAALVGAAAWTAPVIVDSLMSPAAAVSASGCFRVEFVRTASSGCGTYTRSNPAGNGSGCFDPSIWNNVPEYPGSVSLTPSLLPPGGPCLYTLEISASSGCTIDSRSSARKDQSNDCSVGLLATGCHTMTFTPPFLPDRFKILISCNGVLCTGGAACPPAP